MWLIIAFFAVLACLIVIPLTIRNWGWELRIYRAILTPILPAIILFSKTELVFKIVMTPILTAAIIVLFTQGIMIEEAEKEEENYLQLKLFRSERKES